MKTRYWYKVAELRQLQKIIKVVKRLLHTLLMTTHADLGIEGFLGLPSRAEYFLLLHGNFFSTHLMLTFWASFKLSTLAKALFIFVVEVNFMTLLVSQFYLFDRNQVNKKPQ